MMGSGTMRTGERIAPSGRHFLLDPDQRMAAVPPLRGPKTKSPGAKAEACDPARVHPANQSSKQRLTANLEQMMTELAADKMSRPAELHHSVASQWIDLKANDLRASWRRWRSSRSPSAPTPANAKPKAASLHLVRLSCRTQETPRRGASN